MINKQKYSEFYKFEEDNSIFLKDWWLDTVCLDVEYDIVPIEKEGEIVVSMQYFIKYNIFFKIILLLILTKRLGSYIKYPKNQKYNKRLL